MVTFEVLRLLIYAFFPVIINNQYVFLLYQFFITWKQSNMISSNQFRKTSRNQKHVFTLYITQLLGYLASSNVTLYSHFIQSNILNAHL